MKKYILLVIFVCSMALMACKGEKQISGKVIEYKMQEDIGIVSFVMQTEEGKNIGILMTDETSIISLIDGMTADEFKHQGQENVKVLVSYDRSKRSMLTQDGEKISAYNAVYVEIREVLTDDAVRAANGTKINVWKTIDGNRYKLEDGTEILWEKQQIGPQDVYVGNLESYDDLSETAKKKVSEFYESRGLLYKVQDEYENAYRAYLECEDKKEFQSFLVGQEIFPSASTERIMCFQTMVTWQRKGEQLRIGEIFDKKTGEQINAWELFYCSEEEAKRAILDIAGVEDKGLRAEMEAAFQPEYITLSQECLEVSFPKGTLPSQTEAYMLGIEYDKRLCEIMKEWAIP